ncbi:MAG: hypothetical protein CVU05_08825 [Bacteroidetes bacterium HGW-Bacteroidetes-21]|jgi:hypothetical protein|nr:MAG: hypothetical protein CVU05_08825 [Bacteroidetes bacterium HGW-Bacteroidetes-21]
MKNFLFVLLIALSSFSCNQITEPENTETSMNDVINDALTEMENDTSVKSFSSPIRYNDYIINLQTRVYEKIITLVKCFDTCDDKELRASYADFGEEAIATLKEIKRLGDYSGNTDFRDKATDLFAFYVEVYEGAYKELIDIVISGKMDEKTEKKMNKIVEEVSEKETALDNAFQIAQQKFADENGMQIIENDLQKEIDNL